MDLIDREAALDAHCTIVCGHKHKQDAACLMECPDYEVFNHLPSAQAEPDKNTPQEQPYLDGLMAKMDEANEDTVIRWWDVLNVIFTEIDSCDKALLYMAPGTNEKKNNRTSEGDNIWIF